MLRGPEIVDPRAEFGYFVGFIRAKYLAPCGFRSSSTVVNPFFSETTSRFGFRVRLNWTVRSVSPRAFETLGGGADCDDIVNPRLSSMGFGGFDCSTFPQPSERQPHDKPRDEGDHAHDHLLNVRTCGADMALEARSMAMLES